jgi:hypothetical protein
LASKLNLVTKRKVLRKFGKNITICPAQQDETFGLGDGKKNVLASMSN